ncbi:MAG TPA: GNAT family N-acetyltransferase [Candidatus Polarisedimenticolia bacterium]|nr:GNAT family N-acetyltransferase [Candidatus Polarisedimenticolia bacterium]
MPPHGAEYAIRAATAADLETVLYHRRRMFEDMGYTDPAAMQAMLASSTPLLAQGLASGRYRGWFAETEGVGVVAGGGVIILDFQSHPIDPRPQRAWVVNMFTEPEHRHRGLARRLMDAMIAWCRAERMTTLYLHASEFGRPLYESLGFEPTNEMRLTL